MNFDILRIHTCNLSFKAPLMVEPAHFSNNQHYQFKTDLTSDFHDIPLIIINFVLFMWNIFNVICYMITDLERY